MLQDDASSAGSEANKASLCKWHGDKFQPTGRTASMLQKWCDFAWLRQGWACSGTTLPGIISAGRSQKGSETQVSLLEVTANCMDSRWEIWLSRSFSYSLFKYDQAKVRVPELLLHLHHWIALMLNNRFIKSHMAVTAELDGRAPGDFSSDKKNLCVLCWGLVLYIWCGFAFQFGIPPTVTWSSRGGQQGKTKTNKRHKPINLTRTALERGSGRLFENCGLSGGLRVQKQYPSDVIN